MRFLKSLIGLILLCLACGHCDEKKEHLPVVIWHGMGDSCCFSFSMGRIKALIEDQLPGIYVYSIRIGNNEIEDVERSYFGNINNQIQEVCDQLAKDERLRNGYNAIGFSQGAQFLRAVAQRCPHPPMVNYVSIGGQHQGVYGVPNCGNLENRMCDYIRRVLKHGAYLRFIQEKLVQATYWHDPLQEDEYRTSSILMPDINNDIRINETYKENLLKLKNMVLVKFTEDSMVTPSESEWFGFYEPGQATKVIPLKELDIYKQDRLGLKTLYDAGRLHFLSVPSNHLRFTEPWFIDNIINKYLT